MQTELVTDFTELIKELWIVPEPKNPQAIEISTVEVFTCHEIGELSAFYTQYILANRSILSLFTNNFAPWQSLQTSTNWHKGFLNEAL